MAGMALEKTWVVSEYTADLGTSALNCAMALFQVKEAMKAHGWTVSTSRDGVAGGSVTGDNWIDAGDVVWAASSNHSWIVMTNAAISANFAICIDCLYAELVELIEDITGRQLEIEFQPSRPGDVRDSQADTTRLLTLFPDIDPVELRVGLEETVAWHQQRLTSTV